MTRNFLVVLIASTLLLGGWAFYSYKTYQSPLQDYPTKNTRSSKPYEGVNNYNASDPEMNSNDSLQKTPYSR